MNNNMDDETKSAIIVIVRKLWQWFAQKCPKVAWWISGIVVTIAAAITGFMTYVSEVPYPENESSTNEVEYVEQPTNIIKIIQSDPEEIDKIYNNAVPMIEDPTGKIVRDTNVNAVAVWTKDEKK